MPPEEPPRIAERLSISLIQPAAASLQRICARTFSNKVDSVNRAIQFYDRIQNVQDMGGKIFIQEPGSDDVAEVKFW